MPFSFISLYSGLWFLALVLIGIPLFYYLSQIVLSHENLSLLIDPLNLKTLFNTLSVASVSLLFGLTIAITLAWLVTRTDLPFRSLFKRIFIFPYMIPPCIFAIAWIMLGVPRIGILNKWLGYDLIQIYSFWGLVFVLTSAYLSLLIIPISQALEFIDPSYEEAARISGARPSKVFYSITLPCIFPAISSSALLFFLSVISAFAIPAFIGNPARFYVLTTRIFTYAKMGGLSGIQSAFILSLSLFLLTVPLVFLNERIQQKFKTRLVGGKSSRISTIDLGALRNPLFIVVMFLTFLVVILPILAIIVSSFFRLSGNFSLDHLTFKNYLYLFQSPEFLRSVVNSFSLAFFCALICVFTGFLMAYFKDRSELKFKAGLEKWMTFPYAIPGTIIALSLILSFGGPNFGLMGSPFLLLFAYIVKYQPIAVQGLLPTVASIDHSLDDAGHVFGASRWRILFKIIIPLLKTNLFNIYVLVFLPVFSEITMSALLTGPGLETIGTLLFQLQDYANPLASSALCTLLMAAMVVTLQIAKHFRIKS